MMNDAISRRALLEKLHEHEHGNHHAHFDDVWYFVRTAPSINAVPVVRCKDCKYRQTAHCPMYSDELEFYDDGFGNYDSDLVIHDRTVDDGFCHCGEKMDGDQHDST